MNVTSRVITGITAPVVLIVAGAGSAGAAVESLGDLRPEPTVAESLWGIELPSVHPTSWWPLTVTANDIWEAMPALLRPGTQWWMRPLEHPHGLSDEIAFTSTAHTRAASGTSFNDIPPVSVSVGWGMSVPSIASWPSLGEAGWSGKRPQARAPMPHAVLPRRGRRGQ